MAFRFDQSSSGLSHLPLLVVAAASLAISCLTIGCAPLQQARKTVVQQTSQFSAKRDDRQSRRKYKAWAMKEWSRIKLESSQPMTRDYRNGFVEGFVDTVYAGGTGEPPIVPPRRFWRVTFRNSEGDQQILHWTQGFRHGAEIALSSGYRDRALLATTLATEFYFLGETPYVEEETSAVELLPVDPENFAPSWPRSEVREAAPEPNFTLPEFQLSSFLEDSPQRWQTDFIPTWSPVSPRDVYPEPGRIHADFPSELLSDEQAVQE